MEFSKEMTGVIITLILQTGAIIWWASKIDSKLGHTHDCIHRIDKELEKRDEHFEKMWERIDEIRDMLP